jgi:hypothetical protein
MAVTRLAMTDEQRKSVALEYLKAFDNKGVTSTGGSILDLFADDAQVFFPKWGLATGNPARLRDVQLDHDRHGRLRVRGDERRRPPGRRVAGRRDARGPLVRRLRGARLPDPALLHLSRSGLRRPRHSALSLALGRRARSVPADGLVARHSGLGAVQRHRLTRHGARAAAAARGRFRHGVRLRLVARPAARTARRVARALGVARRRRGGAHGILLRASEGLG